MSHKHKPDTRAWKRNPSHLQGFSNTSNQDYFLQRKNTNTLPSIGVLPNAICAGTPAYNTVSLYPQNNILFGSAASWGLGKGRDHLPLTCNCSVSTVTALGCQEIPMQVCCGKFPAMTTFCRVLPTLLLLSLCSQSTVMHSTSY